MAEEKEPCTINVQAVLAYNDDKTLEQIQKALSEQGREVTKTELLSEAIKLLAEKHLK